MTAIFSIIMILVGAAFLSLSLFPATKILKSVHGRLRRRWWIILYLMGFFLAGYLFFDIALISNMSFPFELITGGVFLGGAVFVFLIVDISQNIITERQKAEEEILSLNESLEMRIAERTRELERSYTFNRAVLDSIADPISIINIKTYQIIDVNESFLQEFKISRDQVLGKTCYEVTHNRTVPCNHPDHTCPLSTLLSRNDQTMNEHVHWTPTGEKQIMEVSASPIRDGQGEIIHAVHIQREITKRKKAEEALRESRELLRAVVEGTSDAVYVKDRQGRYRLFNTAASRITGKNSDAVLGRDDTFLFDADEATTVMDGDRFVMETGRTTTYEEYLTSATGEKMIFLSTKGPLSDEHGNVVGIFGVARDITERNRREIERTELERKLQHAEKLKCLGVLAGGMAHDFNNLLSVIIGHLELTLMELPNGSPFRAGLENARQSSMQAAGLIREILAYAGKGLFYLGEIDLNEVVSQYSREYRFSEAGNIQFTLALAPSLPKINADWSHVQQMIRNLLVNASEAIGRDNGTITLSTGLQEFDDAILSLNRLDEKIPAGRYVYLEVSDTGCGMDEETKEHLFEPFFTTKFFGRGLGMSAVQGIMRRHSGAILLESSPGQGTIIRLLFPTENEL